MDVETAVGLLLASKSHWFRIFGACGALSKGQCLVTRARFCFFENQGGSTVQGSRDHVEMEKKKVS